MLTDIVAELFNKGVVYLSQQFSYYFIQCNQLVRAPTSNQDHFTSIVPPRHAREFTKGTILYYRLHSYKRNIKRSIEGGTKACQASSLAN